MNTSIASSYTDASNIHHVVNEFADIVPVVRGRIGQYGFVASVDYISVENLSSPKRGGAQNLGSK